jgi:hypothetical protein
MQPPHHVPYAAPLRCMHTPAHARLPARACGPRHARSRVRVCAPQVLYLVPGGPYSANDLAAFAAAAEVADRSLLEAGWELAADDAAAQSGGLGLSDLASLLYDDGAPASLYVTYKLLAEDPFFFRQVGGAGRGAGCLAGGLGARRAGSWGGCGSRAGG